MAAIRNRLPRLNVRHTMCLTRNGERVLSERHVAILEASARMVRVYVG